MEYLGEIIWYLSLPITIYLAVKFTQLNIKHFNKIERLEELESQEKKSED